jgi:hypothetical protein
MTGTEAFAGRLLEALPALRPRYEAVAAECRAEGLGDAIPDVFLDEYSRELLDRFRGDPSGAASELATLAVFLEREYGTDGDVDSLIEAGFLALLPAGRTDPDPAALLGPTLLAAVGRERTWRAEPADAALVQRMLDAVPALEPIARDNTYGEHDDVLVHQFLAEVVEREAANVAAGERLDEVRAVLDLLEAELGTGDVDEPIAVSFVENLPYPGDPGIAIVDRLGPRLRAMLVRQRPSLFAGGA